MSNEWKSGRYVYLIELRTQNVQTSHVQERMAEAFPEWDPTVWGIIEGVDPAFRKLRQLSRETEQDAPQGDRIHSAYKAVAFFRNIWPASFWKWKLIGEPHPETDPEKQQMAGR